MNVVQYLFEKSALLDKDFVLGNKETISHRDLFEKSSRMATFLSGEFGTGNKIILMCNNSNFFLISYLGIMMSGNVCIPLDPTVEQRNFNYILNESEAVACFIEKELVNKLSFGEIRVIASDVFSDLIERHNLFAFSDFFDSNLPAQILFTSGSTGLPKGVVLSHKNIIANTNSIIEYLQLNESDIMEVVLPFYYCYGLSLLHTHLKAGGSIVLNNNFILLKQVHNDINKYKCTGIAGVPSHFQILLGKMDNFKKSELPTLRYITQAGGKLHNRFISELVDSFPGVEIFIMYGQTEATARLSYLEPKLIKEKMGSIGKGIPNVQLKVVNHEGEEVKPGETGEIIAKGDNIMLGYFKDFDNKEVIKNGWLFTGDMGTVDDDGYIFLTARKKELIKVSGKRVSPKEIEEVILSYPGVVDCTIEAVEDEITGEAIKAIVVISDSPSKIITQDELIAFCASNLSIYKVPKHIEFIKELKVNSSGKKVKPLGIM